MCEFMPASEISCEGDFVDVIESDTQDVCTKTVHPFHGMDPHCLGVINSSANIPIIQSVFFAFCKDAMTDAHTQVCLSNRRGPMFGSPPLLS